MNNLLKTDIANDNRKSSFKKIFTFVNLKHIPGPTNFKYINYVKKFQTDILDAFTQTYLDYGHIASFPWPMNSIIIYSPEYIKTVLVDDNRNYIKGEQIEEIKAVVGNGLATNNDHKSWLKSRAFISKEFNKKAVNHFKNNILNLTDKHFAEITKDEIDICESMKLLTFNIACNVFLGSDLPKEDAHKVNEAVDYTSVVTYKRIFKFFPLPYWIPTPEHLEFKLHYKNLIGVVNKLIAKNDSSNHSVLSRLLHTKDEDGNTAFTKKELRDEILTLMLAGHETSAHTLAWFFALIAKHPQEQEKLYKELESLEVSQVNEDNCPHLYNCLYETMRLYPAFPVLSRKSKTQTQLGDYQIPKNTNVVIPIYVLQRSEEFWDSPLEFQPNRFEDKSLLKSYKYLPFSRGPRRCVGELFSMTEMVVIIAKLIKEFKIELVANEIPKDEAFVSLKPQNGLPVKLFRRV